MQARKAGLYKNDDPFYQSPPAQTTPDLWTMTVRVEPDGCICAIAASSQPPSTRRRYEDCSDSRELGTEAQCH